MSKGFWEPIAAHMKATQTMTYSTQRRCLVLASEAEARAASAFPASNSNKADCHWHLMVGSFALTELAALLQCWLRGHKSD